MFRVFWWRALWLVRCTLIACIASLATAQSLPSQDTKAPPGTTALFRSDVRRVVVDVVVTDSLGKPVSNLRRDDFSIAEDGKPQEIRSFDVHNFDPMSEWLPGLPDSLPRDVFVNLPKARERGPLYALLLDLLNMEISDQSVARKQLQQFIRNKPAGTRFAIFVLTDHLYMAQGFTEDRDVLAAVLDPKNSHSRIPRVFLYADNHRPYISTPAILAKIGDYLADLPGHKNLIWLSGSFPSAIMSSSDSTTEALSINDQIKEATDSMARGQIAVYPIDIGGVVATSPTAGAFGSPPGSGAGLIADTMLNAGYMTEEEIAYATGGRAYHSTNDLAGALAEATQTGGRYYTLTYSPANQNYDGRLRHIQVELSKRGNRLEYRRSYYGNADSTALEPTKEKRSSELEPLIVGKPSDSLAPNMQHGAPLSHQLLFRAHVYTTAGFGKTTVRRTEEMSSPASFLHDKNGEGQTKHLQATTSQTYEIDYTIAARYPALEVAAVAYDTDGKILNAAVERVVEERAQIPAGQTSGAIYRVQQKFDVPASATSIRLGVRDVATDNIGALEINLPLPSEEPTASDGENSHIRQASER
jgi:VWFA-related protein